MIYKGYKYRIYPNEGQKELIAKHIGCVRFVYNLALETKIEAYKSGVNYSMYDLKKQLPDLKKECEWLKEVNSQSLQESIINLDKSYKNFFKTKKGFPKFKVKRNGGSFLVPQKGKVDFEKGLFYCPKFLKGIKTEFHRKFEGSIKTCTISRTPTNKYFVSILVAQDKELPAKPKIGKDNTVGIDLGIKDFAVTSEGEVIKNPKYLRNSIKRLKVLQ